MQEQSKGSEAPLPAVLSAPGEAPAISTPQDPLGKIIALGLFDFFFLSEAKSVCLTVPLLLWKIEDLKI